MTDWLESADRWFADGYGKLVEFNFLDLTVGQVLFTLAIVFFTWVFLAIVFEFIVFRK